MKTPLGPFDAAPLVPLREVSIVEIARRFMPRPGTTNTGAREGCFAKPERSRYNRAVRALPYPTPRPPRYREVRGKAAVKATKRARQRARKVMAS